VAQLKLDAEINEKVANDAWDIIVEGLVRDVKLGRIADGFVNAVNACGELLAVDFPRPPGDLDELPNHLIEI
jgi:putative membrane protein